MTRRALSVLAVLALASGQAARGQRPNAVHVPALVQYGKWALLAGSVAMNLAAVHQHHLADDTFGGLTARCTFEEHSLCDTDAAGAYVDPGSEAIYQASLNADRHARTWLVGGETLLLGSAVMFVWQLARPKAPGRNIPFEPKVGVVGGRTSVGLTVAF